MSASDVILDAGCGVCSHLLSLNCGERVGLDISLGNLTIAKNRGNRIHLIRGDAENLPFRDDAFDAVLIVSLLHHLPNSEHALTQICRVIRERGYLLINDSSVTGIRLIYPLAMIISLFTRLLGSPESFEPKLNCLYNILRKEKFHILKINVSTTFIYSCIFSSLKGFIRRINHPHFVRFMLNLFVNATEASFMSLDSKILSRLGPKFGVWFKLVAIKGP